MAVEVHSWQLATADVAQRARAARFPPSPPGEDEAARIQAAYAEAQAMAAAAAASAAGTTSSG